MQEPIDTALAHYQNGYSCAQAILAAYAARYGLTHDEAHGLAAPFGGGLSRQADTCGAVSAALMVLGLHYWDRQAGPREAKEKIYKLSQEFLQQFKQRNGTLLCRELLQLDISDPVDLEQARQSHLFDTRCPNFIRDAVELLDQWLGE